MRFLFILISLLCCINLYAEKDRISDLNSRTNCFWNINTSDNSIKYQTILNFEGMSQSDLCLKTREYLKNKHVFNKAETENSDYLSDFSDNKSYIYDTYTTSSYNGSQLFYLYMIESKEERIRVTFSIVNYKLPVYGEFKSSDVYPFTDHKKHNVEVRNWIRKLLEKFPYKIKDELKSLYDFINNQANDDW